MFDPWFNALFFYGRALTVHERTLMIAYSKKEYESIDPVELPSEITDAQVTSGSGTDEVLPTPAKLKVMIETHYLLKMVMQLRLLAGYYQWSESLERRH
jgi:hypothetical protein